MQIDRKLTFRKSFLVLQEWNLHLWYGYNNLLILQTFFFQFNLRWGSKSRLQYSILLVFIYFQSMRIHTITVHYLVSQSNPILYVLFSANFLFFLFLTIFCFTLVSTMLRFCMLLYRSISKFPSGFREFRFPVSSSLS